MKPFTRGGKSGGARGGKSFGGGARSWDRGEGAKEEKPAFKATCGKCSKMCEVPFKPTGSKPVLCNACFNRDDHFDQKRARGGDRPSFDDKRSSYGEKRSYGADRGESRSYGADRSYGARGGNDNVSEQLKTINMKLDAILRAIS